MTNNETTTCWEDFDVTFDLAWVRDTPAYGRLYGYAARYCELTEVGDWSLTDDERDCLIAKVQTLLQATADVIAAYHDVSADLLIDFAVEDWYARHDEEE